MSSFILSSCSLTLPITATSNPVGSKVGVAKTISVIAFYPDGGDASIQTAAKNAGISKISTVDVKLVWVKHILEIGKMAWSP